jgi:hypothetical protein
MGAFRMTSSAWFSVLISSGAADSFVSGAIDDPKDGGPDSNLLVKGGISS